MELIDIQKILPLAEDWIAAKLLIRGSSADTKYRVTDRRGNKFILRLSDKAQYDEKKRIFDLMSLVGTADIPMTTPVDFGMTSDGECVYSVYSWIEGIDADSNLSKLSEKEQYRFGTEIGEIQRKIHSFEAPEAERFDWYAMIAQRMDEKIGWYRTGGYRIPDEEAILRCIYENMESMKTRPLTLRHSDYQISNFVIMPNGHAGVIDFDFINYGDPLEETKTIEIYTRLHSIPASVGQIHGYFGEREPNEEYFRMMRFYTATSMFSGFHWWAMRGEESARHYIERIKMCSEDFRGFTTDIPVWYHR